MTTNKRFVTEEELKNNTYPLCDRCENYQNNYSTIFGDAWGCKENQNSALVADNDWEINNCNNKEIYDCGKYKNGKPQTVVLG